MYHWRQTTEEDQDSPHALWIDCYNSIASANQALKAIERMDNPESLQPQKGEALLCRAYNHFLLATIFCKAYTSTHAEQDLGIPYMDELETTVNPSYDRGTLATTYQRIAADIEEGLPLIDDNIYSKAKYHFNKKAAYAFAARFYLYYMQSDFSNCRKVIEYADRVLGSNAAESLRNWKALGMLSSNRSVQPNEYVNADNQANLLLISADSYWPLVADPGYLPDHGAHKLITGKNLLHRVALLRMVSADWLCIRNIQRRVIVIRGIWYCRHLQLTKLYFAGRKHTLY